MPSKQVVPGSPMDHPDFWRCPALTRNLSPHGVAQQMPMSLEHFIAAYRDEIIARCQGDGAAGSRTYPVDRESAQSIPLFLDQLGAVLHQGPGANLDIGRSADHHGHDLLLRGFTVSQVVHAYGDVCQTITALAVDKNAPISAIDFGTLNRRLDDAIANAVTEHGRHRDQSTAEDARGRSLDEVRLTQGIESHERLVVSDFINDVGAAGALEANAMGFTFTRPRSLVTLRVRAAADRVLMEIEDECGGLRGERSEDLFRPFEQRGADRTGVGLGLAFSRWGVEANHGRIYARSLPRRGCVFTVDLPRVDVRQDAMV